MSPQLPCLIVGASGAVGSAIHAYLKEIGHPVVGTYCRSASEPRTGEWHQLDVTDSDACASVTAMMAERFGNQFHLIICCGVLADKPIPAVSPEEWRHVLSTNLDGPFFLIRSAFKTLAVGGVGRIVLVGSLSARFGFPGQVAYASSKAALEALCRVTAVELGRFGVTCNVVAPGALAGGMADEIKSTAISLIKMRTPNKRLGNVSEAAEAVAFLLSEAAGHITGQTLAIDGGFSIA